MALKVELFEAATELSVTHLRELHRLRVGKRAAPVVIVVLLGGDHAALCDMMGVETE